MPNHNGIRTEQICIVGYGAILPGCQDASHVWGKLIDCESQIRELPSSRIAPNVYLNKSPDRDATVTKITSNLAGFIDSEMLSTAVVRTNCSNVPPTRLHSLALVAMDECVRCLIKQPSNRTRVGLVLGCMDQDENFTKNIFSRHEARTLTNLAPELSGEMLEKIQAHFLMGETFTGSDCDIALPNSMAAWLSHQFEIQGLSYLIDAACASSLAAVASAERLLLQNRCDLVFAGGVESNLGPESFALFSALSALSETNCLPLDSRSTGITQGEGAVIFAFKRLSDALADREHIFGIISGVGCSSDGQGVSLFEPSKAGQIRALEQAYCGYSVRPKPTYVECHGTGTKLGDARELDALGEFFSNQQFPVGSAKYIFGHTKACAGALSILKALLIIENRLIPPSSYCTSPLKSENSGPIINTQPIPIPIESEITLGVSSFGFGGINFHIAITASSFDVNYVNHKTKFDRRLTEDHKSLVLVADQKFGYSALGSIIVRPEVIASLGIPPQSLLFIDDGQLNALLAVKLLLSELKIPHSALRSERVHVISAGCIGSDATRKLGLRVRYQELIGSCRFDANEKKVLMKAQSSHPIVTEDTGPGVLTNVTAGRIANHFNFHGRSYHIDCDAASLGVALIEAETLLREQGGVAIVVSLQEELSSSPWVTREAIRCMVLAENTWALTNQLPILSSIGSSSWHIANAQSETFELGV